MADEPGLFVPPQYKARDPTAIVRAYPFALFVTTGNGGIRATSIPLFFESDTSTDAMFGHLARRNPQAGTLVQDMPALAVFSGPHAYISAAWYREKPEVPTWDYVVAQVRGTIRPIDDAKESLSILERTASILEAGTENAWTLADAPPGRVEALLPHIRSFRLEVASIEGVTKLSQSHPVADRQNVVRQLLTKGDDGNAAEVAHLIALTDLMETLGRLEL